MLGWSQRSCGSIKWVLAALGAACWLLGAAGCSKKRDPKERAAGAGADDVPVVTPTGPATGAECERVAAHLEKLSGEPMPSAIRARFVGDCTGVLKRVELDCILAVHSSFQDTFKCRKWEPSDPPRAEPLSGQP